MAEPSHDIRKPEFKKPTQICHQNAVKVSKTEPLLFLVGLGHRLAGVCFWDELICKHFSVGDLNTVYTEQL